MIAALKAEFKKLLSVRSTYIITILVALFVAFIAFYVEGWRLKPDELLRPDILSSDVFGALNLSVFGAVIAVLLASHEYRYNTIMYTLTSTNRRAKILIAKFVAVSCYALVLTVIIGVLSPIMSYLGIHAAGHSLIPQTLHYGDLIWRSLFYGWGYAVAGLLLAVLIRNQIGAIVALFVIPSAIEGLLSQLLRDNAVYLPFNSLSQVIGSSNVSNPNNLLAPGKAAWVFLIYLVVGWIVAWYLFLRRDAN